MDGAELELEPVPIGDGIVWRAREDRPPLGPFVAFALFAFFVAGGAEWLGLRRERRLLEER